MWEAPVHILPHPCYLMQVTHSKCLRRNTARFWVQDDWYYNSTSTQVGTVCWVPVISGHSHCTTAADAARFLPRITWLPQLRCLFLLLFVTVFAVVSFAVHLHLGCLLYKLWLKSETGPFLWAIELNTLLSAKGSGLESRVLYWMGFVKGHYIHTQDLSKLDSHRPSLPVQWCSRGPSLLWLDHLHTYPCCYQIQGLPLTWFTPCLVAFDSAFPGSFLSVQFIATIPPKHRTNKLSLAT